LFRAKNDRVSNQTYAIFIDIKYVYNVHIVFLEVHIKCASSAQCKFDQQLWQFFVFFFSMNYSFIHFCIANIDKCETFIHIINSFQLNPALITKHTCCLCGLREANYEISHFACITLHQTFVILLYSN
jgi:hypothetical protein